MIRLRSVAATVLAAGVLALPLTACTDSSTAENSSASVAPGGPSSSDASTEPGPTTPTDPNIPTVAGPSPAPNTDAPETSHADAVRACGQTSGPDGALQVVVLAGDISCDEVTEVLDGYAAPMRASGQEHDIDGWTCGPAKVVGELFRCTKDGTVIALTP